MLRSDVAQGRLKHDRAGEQSLIGRHQRLCAVFGLHGSVVEDFAAGLQNQERRASFVAPCGRSEVQRSQQRGGGQCQQYDVFAIAHDPRKLHELMDRLSG
jgi:hypothetical protein